jgi:hypothetical protein
MRLNASSRLERLFVKGLDQWWRIVFLCFDIITPHHEG